MNKQHPGFFIKKNIIPSKLTVKDAAALLGVGRSALSNLLNGNSSLSVEMANKLSRVFDADREFLVQMQKDYDESQNPSSATIVKNYIPPFLQIKSNEISDFFQISETRSLLAVLLRKLIHSTTAKESILTINFPGYNDAERKGWDGVLECNSSNAWVPIGKSNWEFGTSKDFKSKAQRDFIARSSVSDDIQKETTFVFVTPHKWDGKDQWVSNKVNESKWKSVRVYDATDLEQWIEQSIPVQIWLAEKIKPSNLGVQSIEDCWDNWSSVRQPQLTKEIFLPHVIQHQKLFFSWLENTSDLPLIVKADSIDEGKAFICAILDTEEARDKKYKDRAIIFDTAEAIKKLSLAITDFIAIIYKEDVERESGIIFKNKHTILIHPKNLSEKSQNLIELKPLNYQDFNSILVSQGLPEDTIDNYSRKSGRSITVLRRQLAVSGIVKIPKWSNDKAIVKSFIPMFFVGSWATNSEGDIAIMKLLSSEENYNIIEEKISQLLDKDDTPLWRIGFMRGIISKIDAFYSIQTALTARDIDNFFCAAEIVLSEIDPSVDLADDKKWFAKLYVKSKNHTNALKNGICETLVMLAVHGNDFLQEHLGINIKQRVNMLVKKLLTPLEEKKLLSQNDNLTYYAEAAPEIFIDIIEHDLKSDHPILSILMQSAKANFFSGCPRTNLLWALELLAWNSDYLINATKILARLTEYKLNDSWSNKPYHSLYTIYNALMPQTSATLEERKKALSYLIKTYPEVGFEVCIAQFNVSGRWIGEYSFKPRWKSDATGYGDPIMQDEAYQFIQHAKELSINFQHHGEYSFQQIVERMELLNVTQQKVIWDSIKSWSKIEKDINNKLKLRDSIREYAMTLRSIRRGISDQIIEQAREIYDLLSPSDTLLKHRWLFEKIGVQLAVNEDFDEINDYEERQKKLQDARNQAINEIWMEMGFDALVSLIEASEDPGIIGWSISKVLIEDSELELGFIRLLQLNNPELHLKINLFYKGYLQGLSDNDRIVFFSKIKKMVSEENYVRILLQSPINSLVWKEIETLSDESIKFYWNEVKPNFYARLQPEEMHKLVNNLIDAKRARTAFQALHLDFEHINSQLLFKILYAIANNEPHKSEFNSVNSYDVARILHLLNTRNETSERDIATLEFFYAAMLDHTDYELVNLKNQLSQSPYFFMELLAILYKRDDSNEDVKELQFANRQNLFAAAYSITHSIKFVPGQNKKKEINSTKLKDWIIELQKLCKIHARTDVGDSAIGQLLSALPKGQDDIWPCEESRAVLEEILNPKIASGISVGRYNSRGVLVRATGGSQERQLAEEYYSWAKKLSFEYPNLSNLLRRIGEGYSNDAIEEDQLENIRQRLEI